MKHLYFIGSYAVVQGRFASKQYTVGQFNDQNQAERCAKRVAEAHEYGIKSVERWNALVDIAESNHINIGKRMVPEPIDPTLWEPIEEYNPNEE